MMKKNILNSLLLICGILSFQITKSMVNNQLHSKEKEFKTFNTPQDQLNDAIVQENHEMLTNLYKKHPAWFTSTKYLMVYAPVNALQYATCTKRNGSIKTLLTFPKVKQNLNARDKNGSTALMMAVEFNYPVTAQLLLEAGANPNIANKTATPLNMAKLKNNPAMISLLQQYGAK